MDTTLAHPLWTYLGMGYLGFVTYLLTSLVNPADESLASLAAIFLHRGRTVLTGAIVTPVLVLMAQSYGELSFVAAFSVGYANISLIRKGTETWTNRSKIAGG